MSAAYRQDASRQGLITLGLLVAIILVGWLLLWPKYSGWRENTKELAAAELDLISKQNTLDSFSRLIANYQAKTSELSVLEVSLPSAPKVPQLIFNLESLIAQSGLKMNSVRITDPTVLEESYAPTPPPGAVSPGGISNPTLVELKVEVSVEGDYATFRGLLAALESNLRLFDVKSITATPVGGTGQVTGAAFSLVLGTSYQK